jgi:hypothetical protein
MLDAANYHAIEKLRDGQNYIIRAQRRDDNILDALHRRAGVRSFYWRFLTRKHRLNNFEAAFYLNVDFIRQVALLADLHGEIIGGARYYIWSRGQADIAFIVGVKTKASPQRCCFICHSSPAMPVSLTFTRIPYRTIGGRCACLISWAFPAPPRTSAT